MIGLSSSFFDIKLFFNKDENGLEFVFQEEEHFISILRT